MLTIEELHIHYKNVRARIDNAAKKPAQIKEAPKAPKAPKTEIDWKVVFDGAKEKYGVIKTPYMEIVNEVCKEHDISRELIFSGTRKKNAALVRGIIYDRIRKELGWSYPKIGNIFGKDHTTVLHGIKMALQYRIQNGGEKDEK